MSKMSKMSKKTSSLETTEKPSKKRINVIKKGKGFEGRVAKKFSLATGEKWRRTFGSGAFSKQKPTEEDISKKQRGDIICSSNSLFLIECKNRQSWEFHLVFHEKNEFRDYWEQVTEDHPGNWKEDLQKIIAIFNLVSQRPEDYFLELPNLYYQPTDAKRNLLAQNREDSTVEELKKSLPNKINLGIYAGERERLGLQNNQKKPKLNFEGSSSYISLPDLRERELNVITEGLIGRHSKKEKEGLIDSTEGSKVSLVNGIIDRSGPRSPLAQTPSRHLKKFPRQPSQPVFQNNRLRIEDLKLPIVVFTKNFLPDYVMFPSPFKAIMRNEVKTIEFEIDDEPMSVSLLDDFLQESPLLFSHLGCQHKNL